MPLPRDRQELDRKADSKKMMRKKKKKKEKMQEWKKRQSKSRANTRYLVRFLAQPYHCVAFTQLTPKFPECTAVF